MRLLKNIYIYLETKSLHHKETESGISSLKTKKQKRFLSLKPLICLVIYYLFGDNPKLPLRITDINPL